MSNIESLARRVTNEVNKLLRQAAFREQNEELVSEEIQFVPFSDFEFEAQRMLQSDKMGWKQEFEKQAGFRSGIVKRWNQQGRVPVGALLLCRNLKPIPQYFKRSGRWLDDEIEEVRRLHAQGKPYHVIGEELQKKFGDRRNYLDDGPIAGAIRRFCLAE